MENPFDKKKEKSFWMSWNDHDSYKKLHKIYNEIDLNDWDKNFLVQQVWNRMQYIYDIMLDLRMLCEDEHLANDLDTRLLPLLKPTSFSSSAANSNVGKQYLEAVAKMIETSFLDPIAEFQVKYAEYVKAPNAESIVKFLNEAKFIFDYTSATKTDPFTYKFNAFPSVKNNRTQEVILHEPIELSIILGLFETKLNELSNVCKTISESIDIWGERRTALKKHLMEFSISQSQISVAKYQANITKWGMWFQILTIIFTICVILLGDRVNLSLENENLRQRIRELNTQKASAPIARHKD